MHFRMVGALLAVLLADADGIAGAQPVPAPPLSAVPGSVTLAPGARVAVGISVGSAPIAASAADPDVAVTVDQTARTVYLTGIRLGTTTLQISDAAGNRVDVDVHVVPPAGVIPDRIAVTLTGNPAASSFLGARIDAAIDAAIGPSLAPGSSIRAATILPAPQLLASGFLTTFQADVDIDPGPGTAAVTGTIAVDVTNAALGDFRPSVLAFADDPEKITADGVLSRTTVDVNHPTRLYYYHENVRERRRFCVVLSANDSVMTHVQIVDAAAGPNADVMTVGHAVTKTFLTLQPANEATVVAIAGGKPVLERDTVTAPGEGIVGALDLRVLDGGPLTATVMAIPLAADPRMYLYGPKLPDDGHSRHGSFDLHGFGERIVAYTAGGPDARYVYGTRAQSLANLDPADAGRDFGDYGVLQRVTFDLDNPSDVPARVYLYEKPLGGDVRSSFLVNGNLVDVGCVRVPQHYLVWAADLPPHATGAFEVLTMTDGGSHYPLEIGVSGTPPLPNAPPISAADGCFPKPGSPPAATQPRNGTPGH
jgi:hypothetical protein